MQKINEIADNLDLTDIWRDMHPDETKFTWRQRNPQIHCRLDFFLISNGLCPYIKQSDIKPGYKTDHSMIIISILPKTNPRGPGFWKLNTSFLTEIDYVNKIKTTVIEVQNEYKKENLIDDSLLWEMIKMKIREVSLRYAKIKKANIKNKEAELEAEISCLESLIDNNNLEPKEKENIFETLDNKKKEFEQISQYKTKGSVIRSKARWYNDGEKNSKYFFNLEKRHYKACTIAL